MIILVTGGVRSGKSYFAFNKAVSLSGKKVFLATAEALDEEMQSRIEEHRKLRGPDWDTVEEPLDISRALRDAQKKYQVVLLDCITLWLSNLLTRKSLDEGEAKELIEEFADILPSLECDLVVVSNEVGMGVVPENRLARVFRDLTGLANQRVGEAASEAYFMVSGLPMKLK